MGSTATDLITRVGIISFLVHISQPRRPVCGKGTEAASSAAHLSSLEVNQKFNQAGVKPSNRNHAKALRKL